MIGYCTGITEDCRHLVQKLGQETLC